MSGSCDGKLHGRPAAVAREEGRSEREEAGRWRYDNNVWVFLVVEICPCIATG